MAVVARGSNRGLTNHEVHLRRLWGEGAGYGLGRSMYERAKDEKKILAVWKLPLPLSRSTVMMGELGIG